MHLINYTQLLPCYSIFIMLYRSISTILFKSYKNPRKSNRLYTDYSQVQTFLAIVIFLDDICMFLTNIGTDLGDRHTRHTKITHAHSNIADPTRQGQITNNLFFTFKSFLKHKQVEIYIRPKEPIYTDERSICNDASLYILITDHSPFGIRAENYNAFFKLKTPFVLNVLIFQHIIFQNV